MTQCLPDELYVLNLPRDATEREVVDVFEQHGKVREYVVVSKRRENNFTQAALLRMEDHRGALAAKASLNRTEFKGRTLNIRWSHTQRVIWVRNIHESVTNEVLHAAFSQFGNIMRAVVIADAQTLVTKCYGFVVFENKKDAIRAMQKCNEQPFLVGQSSKPVKLDWARLEDTDQGFSEEARSGNKLASAKDFNPQVVSHFAAPGSREYLMAVRLAEIEVEYTMMKAAMKSKMSDLQNQLMVSGQAPSLASALVNDPLFAVIRVAGAAVPPQQGMAAPPLQPLAPAPGQYARPPGPAVPAPVQYGAAPPARPYVPPAGQYGAPPQAQYPGQTPKRDVDVAAHMPPAKRPAMQSNDTGYSQAANQGYGAPPQQRPPTVLPVTAFMQGGQDNRGPKGPDTKAYEQQQQQADRAGSVPGPKLPGPVPPPRPPPVSSQYGAYQQPQQQQISSPAGYGQYQQQQQQQQPQYQAYGQAQISAGGPPPGAPASQQYAPAAQQAVAQGQQQTPQQQYGYSAQQPAPAAQPYQQASQQPQQYAGSTTYGGTSQYGSSQYSDQYTASQQPQYAGSSSYAAATGTAAAPSSAPAAMSGYGAQQGAATQYGQSGTYY